MAKMDFWAQVRKTPTCWWWTGPVWPHGYGRVSGDKRSRYAHILSWIMANGRRPVDCVLHRCDNKLCVRPKHLWEGSKADNNADCIRKGRARHCKGESQPNSKLTDAAVRKIRRLSAKGYSRVQLADMFGVSPALISYVALRKIWTHV